MLLYAFLLVLPLLAWSLIVARHAASQQKRLLWLFAILLPSLYLQLFTFLRLLDTDRVLAFVLPTLVTLLIPAGLGCFIRGFRKKVVEFISMALPSKQDLAKEIREEFVKTVVKFVLGFLFGVPAGAALEALLR